MPTQDELEARFQPEGDTLEERTAEVVTTDVVCNECGYTDYDRFISVTGEPYQCPSCEHQQYVNP